MGDVSGGYVLNAYQSFKIRDILNLIAAAYTMLATSSVQLSANRSPSTHRKIELLPGMTEAEGLKLFERIGATAIANQAILKCTVAGFPLTADNVIVFVGDFVDPARPETVSLVELIGIAIDEVLDCRGLVGRAAAAGSSAS